MFSKFSRNFKRIPTLTVQMSKIFVANVASQCQWIPKRSGHLLKNYALVGLAEMTVFYAEMLETKHSGLVALIARIFTDILQGIVEIPEVWCVSRLVVLYKKGDATLPKNCRLIE